MSENPQIEVRILINPQIISDVDESVLIGLLGEVALNEARAIKERGQSVEGLPPVEIS